MKYNDDGTQKWDMTTTSKYISSMNTKWLNGLVNNKELMEYIQNREWNELSDLERTVYVLWSLEQDNEIEETQRLEKTLEEIQMYSSFLKF
tara:strand:+ start:337 stop:609 length:273 start_codon:yes stop_codon:yes gene_type:complete